MDNRKPYRYMLLLLVLALVFSLAGCGGNTKAAEIDENAKPFVGIWQGDTVTMTAGRDKTSRDFSTDVSVTLDADMTGKLTVNDSTQKITWEVFSSNTAEDRALITLKKSFPLAGLELDPEQMFLGVEYYGEEEIYLYWSWNSAAVSGRISLESLMKKVG